mmetsp:Transcript_6727/g.14054  ORF Transcript_6727/g.14054 Transcript_6727/m.14054 type:complete len:114 (-) Transcript_6727:333-674(-)
MQGPRFCRRSNDCRLIYKCAVPTLCNVVVPGKKHSEEGWLKIGYCGNGKVTSSLSDENIEEEQVVTTIEQQLPSSFPTPLHAVDTAVTTGSQGTEDALGDEEVVPTSRPTSWQ